jgi:hypothetical protein
MVLHPIVMVAIARNKNDGAKKAQALSQWESALSRSDLREWLLKKPYPVPYPVPHPHACYPKKKI